MMKVTLCLLAGTSRIPDGNWCFLVKRALVLSGTPADE
jgi:hypothetical protein